MSKNIFVINSGSYEPIPVVYDDNSALSSSVNITLNTASYVGQSGLMQIKDGKLIPVATSSSIFTPETDYSGSVLTYDANEGFGPHRLVNRGFSGDITGDALATPVRVRSVSNVESGTLSSQYGGLTTSSFEPGSIITTSGSGPAYGQSDKVLAVIDSNNNWGLTDRSIIDFTPMTGTLVYLYTGSVGDTILGQTGPTFTWTKPVGCRFIRVICQGAGGGGCSGRATISSAAGGGGGGGGGYGAITLNALSVTNNVSVRAGMGGKGAISGGGITYGNRNPGESSWFGSYITSYGGHQPNAATITTAVTRANGYLINGGGGAVGSNNTGAAASPTPTNLDSILGAPGGGGGSGIVNTGAGTAGGQLTDLVGGSAGAAAGGNGGNGNTGYSFYFDSYYLNGVFTTGNFPKLRCSGGGGGGARGSSGTGGTGGSATFGAGGGGGGGSSIGNSAGNGGNGGVGYVLIICY